MRTSSTVLYERQRIGLTRKRQQTTGGRWIALTVALLLFLTPGAYGSDCVRVRGSPVLAQIETYQAPEFPSQGSRDRETYDYRIRDGNYVPPTLTDTLIADLWTVMTRELDLRGISPKRVPESEIGRALKVYLDKDWKQIPGFRPWTHWNFVRCLTEEQRSALAKEAAEYIAKIGVRSVIERR